jgi:hypothetical protein
MRRRPGKHGRCKHGRRWLAGGLSPGRLLSAAVLCAAAGLVAAPAAVALAATHHIYTEGTSSVPLSVTPSQGAAVTPLPGNVITPLPAKALVLSFSLVTVVDARSPAYGGVPPDPRSLQWLSGGNILVADRNSSSVRELDPAGRVVWSYSPQDARDGEAPLVKPFAAQRFTRLGQELTLIVDRNGKRVFVVDDATRRVVWEYGKSLTPGNGPDRLVDPFYAEFVKARDPANDTILITEDKSVDQADPAQRANRVIEVRYADYEPGAPDDGFTGQSIVWRYGSGMEGTGVDRLFKPHAAQRLADGDTLITDTDNDRVIVVRTADYDPSLPNDGYHEGAHPSVVWQYGITNVQGDDGGRGVPPGYLADPNWAGRLPNGHTLIVDTGHSRVLDVGPNDDVRVVQLDKPNQPVSPGAEPRAVAVSSDGALLIADSAENRILAAGFSAQGTATSGRIDCGHSQWQKRFLRIDWDAEKPAGTRLSLFYRIDPPTSAKASGSASWRSAGTSGSFTLPTGAVGGTIQYQVRMTSEDGLVTPTLTSVSVEYTHWTAPSTSKEKKTTRPIGSVSMGGPAQTSDGQGWSGSGYGSGSGAGTGAGTGNGVAAAGSATTPAGSGATAAQTSTSAATGGPDQLPASSAGEGADESVTGQVVGAGAIGGGSQGGGSTAYVSPREEWRLWAALIVGVLLATWSVIAVLAERQRRALTGHDHTARAMPGGGLPLLKGPG